MNSLTITQTKANGIVEGPVSNQIITKLYNIGKDDDEHQTLTVGVDTTDENRPVSTVSGRIRVNSAFANQLEYLAVKFPDLEINADSTYIYFEDPEVERVLLAAGIGDGTGITMQDAATANINRTIFKNNTDITSFNELPLFTRMNSQAMYFQGCTNLESVDLSEVTTLWLSNNQYCSFKGCSKLKTIGTLSEGITIIPAECFRDCTHLTNINIPSTVTEIQSGAFLNTGATIAASDLENIVTFGGNIYTPVFSQQTVSGDELVLTNCTKLSSCTFGKAGEGGQRFKKVYLPAITRWDGNSNIQTFAENPQLKEVYMTNLKYGDPRTGQGWAGPFLKCANLEKVTISNQAVDIISNFLYTGQENTSVKLVNIPTTVIRVNDGAFLEINGLTGRIVYLPNATTVGMRAFTNDSYMHIYLPSLTSTPACVGVYNEYPNESWLGYRGPNYTKSYIATLYLKDISSFGAGSFNDAQINTIIINNVQPPALVQHTNSTLNDRDPLFNQHVFHGLLNPSTVNIYVPDSAVSAYTSAPQYADIASRIKGLSDSSLHHITAAEIEPVETGDNIQTYDDNGTTRYLYGTKSSVDGIIDAYMS